jgi:Trk K+ transport system NAD-binding subunit
MTDACHNSTSAKRGKRRGHAIIVGYGPVGRCAADQLRDKGYEIVIIEVNLDTVERQLTLDQRVVYGDACDSQTLAKAGISEADALIVTIPALEATLAICKAARALNAALYIAVRVRHASGAMLALQAGADDVTIEEIVTARAMADQVSDRLRHM